MEFKVSILLVFSLFVVGFADINLHNPRGGNNRLDEPNRDRRNAKRLFDSQNNNRGGHNVGGLYYYGGSTLQIQWALQHSCGDRNSNCEVVIQYMCDKTLRDGTTINTIPEDPKQCQNFDCNSDLRYGMHENLDYYKSCKTRERNKGLFTADQNLRGRETARFTRQDRNGNRYAYECPEERDYYPYWHPSPWKDIAVMTNDVKRCPYYQQESENVKGRSYCKIDGDVGNTVTPNNEESCLAFRYPAGDDNGVRGQWINKAAHSLPAPECMEPQWSRDNHQGNTIGGFFMSYNWTVPDFDQDKCVMRIRYNISTGEYDGWDSDVNYNLNGRKVNIGARFGLDFDSAYKRGYSLHGNPDVSIFSGVPNFKLRVNVDTGNFGRTFQDRTHLFSIRKRPASLKGKKIFNVNVRGKRGNIVQVFPSTEYDFVPNTLEVSEGDYVHYQWTGSNTNDRNNAGQGLAGTDRSNVVPLASSDDGPDLSFGNWRRSYPANISTANFLGFERQDLKNLALVRPNQLHGEVSELDDAGTYFDLGPRMVTGVGAYHYMSTRNNAFTNRSQKGRIIVKSHPTITKRLGWNGGSLVNGDMSVFFPTGYLSSTRHMRLEEISDAEGERLIQQVKGILPPGSGYASPYFLLSPQSKLQGCDSGSAEVIIRLSRAYGVNIYHSSESLGYRTWHLVKSRLSIMHASFTTVHGGIFVARTV